MTKLQLKIMKRSDQSKTHGCYCGVRFVADKEERSKTKYGYGYLVSSPPGYNSNCRFISVVQLKDGSEFNTIVMEKDDCVDYFGHPYGFARLMRLYKENLYNMGAAVEGILSIGRYLDSNTYLYDKPCIDRPEEGQKLVLDFLQILPKGTK